jgi:hypothetical protein
MMVLYLILSHCYKASMLIFDDAKNDGALAHPLPLLQSKRAHFDDAKNNDSLSYPLPLPQSKRVHFDEA